MTTKNVAPILPSGMKVVDRTRDIEFLRRSTDKWVPVIDTLKIIDKTKCVEIDITGADKKAVLRIKNGIRNTARGLGYKERIEFTLRGYTLYVWTVLK